ncbi:hypothetical protein [Aquella oligotrophica]|uniref:Uncharacterized protein n=1 Tax=Aquella oligotrophica TaxID=2067065 RepID=A0A2I7N6G6_9NEIS|nr:hypothetical protein [Aquella oligotrophica]AUR52063.1 hypothetical protein CUN60_07040 [Aquella oligotrophica]
MLVRKSPKKELRLKIDAALYDEYEELTKKAENLGYEVDLTPKLEKFIKIEIDRARKQLDQETDRSSQTSR